MLPLCATSLGKSRRSDENSQSMCIPTCRVSFARSSEILPQSLSSKEDLLSIASLMSEMLCLIMSLWGAHSKVVATDQSKEKALEILLLSLILLQQVVLEQTATMKLKKTFRKKSRPWTQSSVSAKKNMAAICRRKKRQSKSYKSNC